MFQVTFSSSVPTSSSITFCGRRTSLSQRVLARIQPDKDVSLAVQAGQPHLVKILIRQSFYSQGDKMELVQAARANTKRQDKQNLRLAMENGLVSKVKQLLFNVHPAWSNKKRQVNIETVRGKRDEIRERRKNPFISPPSAVKQQKQKERLEKHEESTSNAETAFSTTNPTDFRTALRHHDLDAYFAHKGEGEVSEGMQGFCYKTVINSPEATPSKYDAIAKFYIEKGKTTRALNLFKMVLNSSVLSSEYREDDPEEIPLKAFQTEQRALYQGAKAVLAHLPDSMVEPYGNGKLSNINVDSDKIPFLRILQKDIDQRLQPKRAKL
jgi:hypothetical protein